MQNLSDKMFKIKKPLGRNRNRLENNIKSEATPCGKFLPEKLTGPQLVKKFLVYHGSRRFMTAFTGAR
jgi:hypothetical protein